MKKAFKEYGGVLIAVVAFGLWIGVVCFLMNTGSAVDFSSGNIVGSLGDKSEALLKAASSDLSVALDGDLSKDSNHPTFVENAVLTLSGRVTGNNGTVTLTVNGTDVAVVTDGAWSTTVDLAQGEVTALTIVATDGEGNAVTKVYYVNYVAYEPVFLVRIF